jgi:hypothetical protein
MVHQGRLSGYGPPFAWQTTTPLAAKKLLLRRLDAFCPVFYSALSTFSPLLYHVEDGKPGLW